MSYVTLGKKYISEAGKYFEQGPVRLALGVGVLVVVSVGGYRWYQHHQRDQQAQAVGAFEEALRSYETALNVELDWSRRNDQPAWSDAEMAFEEAYNQFGSADFGPYLLVYQAQAIAAQQKYAEAAALLDRAIAKLGKRPFADFYRVVRALILIDAQEAAGLTQLQALANDRGNHSQDMARYFLAHYYLDQDQPELAQPLLSALVEEGQSADDQSSWAALAKQYL